MTRWTGSEVAKVRMKMKRAPSYCLTSFFCTQVRGLASPLWQSSGSMEKGIVRVLNDRTHGPLCLVEVQLELAHFFGISIRDFPCVRAEPQYRTDFLMCMAENLKLVFRFTSGLAPIVASKCK